MGEAIISAATLANTGGSSYLEVADLRTPDERYKGIFVKDDDMTDAVLGALILDASQLFDHLTGDHFLPTTGYLITDGPTPDGFGRTGRLMLLPRRVRSVSEVATIDVDGVTTEALDTTTYRVHSSLTDPLLTDTPVFLAAKGYDGIEFIYGLGLDSLTHPSTYSSSSGFFPYPRSIQVTGEFDWAAPPELVKQAVAWMVIDWAKTRQVPPRTQSFSSGRANFQIDQDTSVTGIEVWDRAVRTYRRSPSALAAV